jgi:hypothetical protein
MVYFIFLFYIEKKGKIAKSILLSLSFLIAFYFGFRPHTIGGDTELYYSLNKFININNVLSQTEREPIYYLFVSIINFFTNNGNFVFLGISIGLVLAFYNLMKNQINGLFLPVVLVYTWGHFLFLTYNINIIRQGFATVFALLLFNEVLKNKKIKISHFILLFLAILSHYSALILIPFYIIYIISREYNYKIISVFFICLSTFIMIVDTSGIIKNIALFVTDFLNLPNFIVFRLEQYLNIITEIKISYGFLISFSILMLFLSLGNILNSRSKKAILVGQFCYLFLFILFGTNEIFYRMTLYFWIFEFIALGIILEYYYDRYRPVFYIIILFIPFAVLKTYFTLMESEFFIQNVT